MARSELIRDFEALIKKIKAQKAVLSKKLALVDYKKAAEDDSVYESFMPVVEVFQNELDTMQTTLFNEIQGMCDNIVEMYDKIEVEADKLPPVELIGEEFSEEDLEEQEELKGLENDVREVEDEQK